MALKAYGHEQGERELWGRSLTDLCRRWSALDPTFTTLARACRVLDRYYIPPRYPDAVAAGVPADL